MEKIQYTIKCVNKGKPFEMPDWTTEDHETALAKLANDQKKNNWNSEKADNEWKFYVLLQTLNKIDPNCTMDDLKYFCRNPVTLIELFNAVYHAGKENIYYVENFRKGRKTPSTKR